MKPLTIGMLTATKEEGGFCSLDFDIKNYYNVLAVIENVQSKYNLKTPLIIETKKGFHVHFFKNKLSWKKITQIIKETPLVDKQFKKYVLERGYIRVRIFGKDLKQRNITERNNFIERTYLNLIQ